VQGYRAFVDAALGTDTIVDEGMLYLDARLSNTHPTVEVRVADVCRDPDDAVLVAALVRGMVETAIAEWEAGAPPQAVRTEVLRLATWRAARDGVRGALTRPPHLAPRAGRGGPVGAGRARRPGAGCPRRPGPGPGAAAGGGGAGLGRGPAGGGVRPGRLAVTRSSWSPCSGA
jgi:hypothetical protein